MVWPDAHKGFINQVEVYTEKNSDGSRETQLGEKVVMALTIWKARDILYFLINSLVLA